MPITWRKLYLTELKKAKKKEQDATNEQHQSAKAPKGAKGPSIKPGKVSSRGSTIKPSLPRTK